MPHELVLNRLEAIRGILTTAHGGGHGMASSSVGSEREAFVNLVLSNVIGSPFRVGTGEITDPEGNLSGQLDIVIEYSSSLSFPLLRGDSSRLYLTEGVCAVVEVKSDVQRSWNDVVDKARRVRRLSHDVGQIASVGRGLPRHIPFFAVGYRGWATAESVARRVADQCDTDAPIDGVLILEPAVYAPGPYFSEHASMGDRALYSFLLSIEELTSSMFGAKPKYGAYLK